MKSILIYSGKGGVGKTTTTANLAKALIALGYKVFILDGDVNTPSMNVVFPDPKPSENLMIASMGYEQQGIIYIAQSLIRKYLTKCINQINKFQPDYILIDTPPSVTDVHINLLDKLAISGVVMVTQPTGLSRADVNRTALFFESRKINVIGLVENMVYEGSVEETYSWDILAKIPFEPTFDLHKVYENNKQLYLDIIESCDNIEVVALQNQKRQLLDETITWEDIQKVNPTYTALKFINLSTWERMRETILRHPLQNGTLGKHGKGIGHDETIEKCSYDKVKRLVDAFDDDEQAYFLFIGSAGCNTDIQLIPGEIGQASLILNESHYRLPKIRYQTKNGDVILLPHEVYPVDSKTMNGLLATGYVAISDGRYLPSKETVNDVLSTFGMRVSKPENWEKLYDELVH